MGWTLSCLLAVLLFVRSGVSCLAYSSAGRGLLLSSGPDGQAVSLDTHSGSKLSQFKGSKHGASAAALSAGQWGGCLSTCRSSVAQHILFVNPCITMRHLAVFETTCSWLQGNRP
jgi:hypothetical protein